LGPEPETLAETNAVAKLDDAPPDIAAQPTAPVPIVTSVEPDNAAQVPINTSVAPDPPVPTVSLTPAAARAIDRDTSNVVLIHASSA